MQTTTGNRSKNLYEVYSVERVYTIGQRVVNKLRYRRAIPEREMEDILQELMRKYLEKQTKIIEGYKGNASPDTYLTAILYRMCCEIIRSEIKDWDQVNNDDPGYYLANIGARVSEEDKAIIDNEAEYLQKILLLFDDETYKIILFLKVLFGISVSVSDIKKYNKYYRRDQIDALLLNQTFEKNQEVYKVLEQVVNRSENKRIGGDAIRIWLNKRMDQMIDRLNGTIQRSKYDRKSLQILFEYTFSAR